MHRPATSIALGIALVAGSPAIARATPDFPGVVVSELGLPGVTIDPPQGCTLCHTTNAGGTSLRIFGEILLQDGAQPYDESSLKAALQRVQADEPALILDIKGGRDPNDDAAASGTVYTPAYGCDVGDVGAPRGGWWMAALAFAVLVARRRTRGLSRRARALGVALLGLSACSKPGAGAPPSTEPAPCDPRTPTTVALGSILGVGRDARGTFYVADQDETAGTIGRVFVSTGGALYRKHVTASEEHGAPPSADYELAFEDPDPGSAAGSGAHLLLVATGAGQTTEMALETGGEREAPLAVVPASAVSGLPVVDLPSVIEFVGDVSGGEQIVVFGTTDDTSKSSLQVFYGAPPRLVEYPIVSLERSLTAGATLSFEVQWSLFAIRFAAARDPDAGPFAAPSDATLETGTGRARSIVPRLPVPTSLPGLSFFCLGP